MTLSTQKKMPLFPRRFNAFVGISLLVITSALNYLPMIQRISYMNDDWYLMYVGRDQGPDYFRYVFQDDRPARAYVMGGAFFLFGNNPIYYHLSGYIWRLLSGVAVYWLVSILWPFNRVQNLQIALLFLIYPGFLSQVNPIDYQSQLLGLFLITFSLALTARAIVAKYWVLKTILLVISIFTGWVSFAFVEYFFGLEALRWLIIYLLLSRINKGNLFKRFCSSLYYWFPVALIPFGFLIWRLFFFQNHRQATDLGFQLNAFFQTPTYAIERLIQMFWDLLQVTVLAWVIPFRDLVFTLDIKNVFEGAVYVSICVICGVWAFKRVRGNETDVSETNWQQEGIKIGAISALAALVPITLANRSVDFTHFSRYALASSIGASLLLVAGLEYAFASHIRRIGIALLIAIATFTQYANGVKSAAMTTSLNTFWWQVSWRVPGIEERTLLLVNYPPNIPAEEDYFIWGPANQIYAPKSISHPSGNPRVAISAILPTAQNIDKLLYMDGYEKASRRGILVQNEFEDLIIISQTSPDSCVRVIDGKHPEISPHDPAYIKLLAHRSNVGYVLLDTQSSLPPETVFGPEPEHLWCFYFEKAELSQQRQDWETIVKLGDEALRLGLAPTDSIEYLPFLHAYGQLGKDQQLRQVITSIKMDNSLAVERACELALSWSIPASMINILETELCAQP